MLRPRIGITRGLHPSKPAEVIPGTYQRYHDRVREAGGEPVDLHPALPHPPERMVESLDGVLITGGPDLNPSLYGQSPHPETDGIDDARDALEIGLIRRAMARDLPLFAICRGHQALNVAGGGSLQQHIEGDGHRALDGGMGASRWHDLLIERDTRLYTLLGSTRLPANSRHHQAVTRDGIAPGLRPSAYSPDGLVEAMESDAHRWLVSVQWHPEREEVMEAFAPLFRAFVEAAARVTSEA